MGVVVPELVQRETLDGSVAAIYGGTTFRFMEALKNPRWEDFVMNRTETAKANRFTYLGDGLNVRERKGGSVGAT